MITLTMKQVAALSPYSLDWWRRNWPALVRDQGFPPPLPAFRPRQHFAADAVHAWFAAQARGQVPAAAPHADSPPDDAAGGDDIKRWQDELAARAERLAAAVAAE